MPPSPSIQRVFVRWLAPVCVAGLVGIAIVQTFAAWGEHRLRHRAMWRPPPVLAWVEEASSPAAPSTPSFEGARLMGIVDGRAYFRVQAGVMSAKGGDRLPGGGVIESVGRDTVRTASGERLSLFPNADAAKTPPAKSDGSRAEDSACVLSSTDQREAVYIDDAVARALLSEAGAIERIFVADARGVRAQSTGGMASMFAIADGDLLLRADGVALRDARGVTTAVIGRVARGGAVVVDGERAGQVRRWVVASARCRR